MSLIDSFHQLSYSIALVSSILALLVYNYWKKYTYWSNQGIKTPRLILPYFGNSVDFLLKPGLTVLKERWKRCGNVYGFYTGSTPQLVIGDPDMLKESLIKDWIVFSNRVGPDYPDGNPLTDRVVGAVTGEEWKHMRSVISPTFTARKMKHMFGIMSDCCHLLVNNLCKKIDAAPSGDDKNVEKSNGSKRDVTPSSEKKSISIDFCHLAGCYSMDVIAKCCFGTDTNSFDDPNDTFVKHTRGFFRAPMWKIFLKQFLPGYIRRFIGFNQMNITSVNFLAHVSRAIVEQRIKMDGSIRKKDYDYLQLLIEASKNQDNDQLKNEENHDDDELISNEIIDNESHHIHENPNESSEILISEKKPLSTDDIIANSINFLAVGYDTTSLLILFTLYNLCLHQDVQEKLYRELKSILNERKSFDYESISGSKYLDAVISETLRLYPPAIWIERKVSKKYTFSKNGITVPKGGSIWLPIYNLHHDEKYWKNAESFDPNRFLPENRDKIIPYTYLPFGAGPRNCVGMRFALLEAKLGIAHLVTNFSFHPDSKTDIPVDITSSSILLAPKSVILKIEKRWNNCLIG